jgi:hypothetical protein
MRYLADVQKNLSCSWIFDDTIFGEVLAEFEAVAEKCDYGYSRSPIWWEIDEGSISFVGMSIYHETWDYNDLVDLFGKSVAINIIQNMIEQLPNDLDYWTEDE